MRDADFASGLSSVCLLSKGAAAVWSAWDRLDIQLPREALKDIQVTSRLQGLEGVYVCDFTLSLQEWGGEQKLDR